MLFDLDFPRECTFPVDKSRGSLRLTSSVQHQGVAQAMAVSMIFQRCSRLEIPPVWVEARLRAVSTAVGAGKVGGFSLEASCRSGRSQ